MKRYQHVLAFVFCLLLSTVAWAQRDLRFVDLPLSLTPEEMLQKLQVKGLHQVMGAGIPYTYRLTGQINSLPVMLDIYCSKDTLRIEQMRLSTYQAVHSSHGDYHRLMQWMQKHYGAPTWEASVRSHSFARWYLGRDSDIVVIATGSSTVEAWFYANHDKRNVDYYSILKYCENNPVDGVPNLTAQQSITWKNTAPVVAKPKAKKSVRKHGRRQVHKKRTTTRKHRRRR